MIFVVLWLLLSVVVAAAASNRGQSWLSYLVGSLLFSPVIAGLILLVSGTNTKAIEAKAIKSGSARRCSHCAELIRREAAVCKNCGRDTHGASGAAKVTCGSCRAPFSVTEPSCPVCGGLPS